MAARSTRSNRTSDRRKEGSQKSGSVESQADEKPKKRKPLTKKEKEKLKRMEREMKEELVQLRKEADAMLAEFKAMGDAADRKAKTELFEHNKRVELLSGTCDTFRIAKDRLLHENNNVREAQIWERYLTADRQPRPESMGDMRNHLHLWKQSKESDYMEFALPMCDSFVDTLSKLDELIEYPLYSSNVAVANWKELRREWREEFLKKIDTASFNLIKNLNKNMVQREDESHVFRFDHGKEHVQIGICAYVEVKSQGVRLSPKIVFPKVNVEIIMPAVYRTSPFVLRVVHIDQDFLSEQSLTYYCPEADLMEPDLLKEIHRCFEAKNEAKSMVADREREKVRQAKQKVLEAQAAAKQAEMSFQSFQIKNLEPIKKKETPEVVPLDKEPDAPSTPTKPELKRNKMKTDIIVMSPSNASLVGGGQKRVKGVLEDDGDSVIKSVMQSATTLKTLDAISMRSGMRKKQDRTKKPAADGNFGPKPAGEMLDDVEHNIFWTPAMKSLQKDALNVEVRKASELCFGEIEEDDEVELGALSDDALSYESLDLMFGLEPQANPKVPDVKQLVKETVIVDRDAAKQRMKSQASIQYEKTKVRRRGKSNVNPSSLKGRVMTDSGSDEAQQTASDIFDTAEDNRQEHYMSSLVFQSIPEKRYHVNLREYSMVGGTYLLDIIANEAQPHQLPNGNTVQIFHGDLNIKRDDYVHNYKPPLPDLPNPDEAVIDTGLQHLLHVKLSLLKDVLLTDPPIVALWDRDLKYWTTQHVYKTDIDLTTSSASFSIGRALPFAFFMKKYCLLPFENWTMRPNFDTGGVVLSIQSKKAVFEFRVVDFKACLHRAELLEGGAILQVLDIMGEFMHVHKLIAAMKSKGLNIFPDEDGFLYMPSSCKDVVLEDHTYMSLAMFSDTLEFLSSDFNADYKRRKVVFRVRECLPYQLELRCRTVVATSLSTVIYSLGTDDASIDETKIESGYGFCPDVFCLLEKAFAHITSCTPMNPLQVLAVYTLLSRTKVLSYCIAMHQDKSLSGTGSKKSIRRGKKKAGRSNKAGKSRWSDHSLTAMSSKMSVSSGASNKKVR